MPDLLISKDNKPFNTLHCYFEMNAKYHEAVKSADKEGQEKNDRSYKKCDVASLGVNPPTTLGCTDYEASSMMYGFVSDPENNRAHGFKDRTYGVKACRTYNNKIQLYFSSSDKPCTDLNRLLNYFGSGIIQTDATWKNYQIYTGFGLSFYFGETVTPHFEIDFE